MSYLTNEKMFCGYKVRNPFVLPPMVTFIFSKGNGYVSQKNIELYQRMLKHGAGIGIVEATGILQNGRLSVNQLGIWSDDYILGLSKIAKAMEEVESLPILQLHHAGLRSDKEAVEELVTASDFDNGKLKARALSVDEIKGIVKAFAQGAKRAKAAGFKGVEVHGAHGYLLTQFFNSKINKREDEYGGSFENRNRIAYEIYRAIREEVGEDFIVGIRMGCNDDNLKESIERAKAFEKLGFSYLHVSTGYDNTPIELEVPEDFPCNFIVYGATKIKEAVNIPVIGVNMIREKEQIDYLLDKELLDFVALGRVQLADHDFLKKSYEGGEILTCLQCKPCRWFYDARKCPRYFNQHQE